mmetsp:Transcript_1723/g.3071  ORF Transcript_1723/g.3071 Transcript_1723/m.3071 type:complete len:95 (-) Transcript_1723:191-475(-)
MWDMQTPVIHFLARKVFYFLTKKSHQAAACASQMVTASAEGLEQGGVYHSGVLWPPMRNDTTDVGEWNNAAAILTKLLPDDLKSAVKGSNVRIT